MGYLLGFCLFVIGAWVVLILRGFKIWCLWCVRWCCWVLGWGFGAFLLTTCVMHAEVEFSGFRFDCLWFAMFCLMNLRCCYVLCTFIYGILRVFCVCISVFEFVVQVFCGFSCGGFYLHKF